MCKYVTVFHCGCRKVERQFTYNLFPLIIVNELNILLYNYFCSIENLAVDSGDCYVGSLKLKYFDSKFFGIRVVPCVFL